MKIFTIEELVGKLGKIAEANRHDQVSRIMLDVFQKKASTEPASLVASSDVEKIYNTVSGMNPNSEFKSAFAEVFEETTASAPLAENASFNRLSGFNDQERSMPIEHKESEVLKVRNASLKTINEVAGRALHNPQYHFDGYVKVAGMTDSGIANWKVAFETGRGTAKVTVPVVVVNGTVFSPEKFYDYRGEHKFSADNLVKYVLGYVAPDKPSITEHTGVQTLGNNFVMAESMIGQSYPEMAENGSENSNISLYYTIPVDAESDSKIETVKKSLIDAIEKARQEAQSKISKDENGNNISISLNLSYGGAIEFEEEPGAPVQEDEFNGVIAFNASQNTRNGRKVITIPVEVRGNRIAAEAFYDGQNAHPLNGTEVGSVLNSEITIEEDAGAFSDAFLANASFNELRKEMKESIDKGNMKRAEACLRHIADNHSEEATAAAMSDYIDFTREAAQSKNNVIACQGCKFFEKGNTKGSVRAASYCNKLATEVNLIKRGSFAPRDCVKKSTSINWDTENDKMYSGVIKSSSIVIN
jgi:hypothetical protein